MMRRRTVYVFKFVSLFSGVGFKEKIRSFRINTRGHSTSVPVEGQRFPLIKYWFGAKSEIDTSSFLKRLQLLNKSKDLVHLCCCCLYLFLIFQYSCIERYDLFIPAKGKKYVVEATLLDDERYQFVKLTNITNGEMEMIPGARVMFEETTGMSFPLVQSESGDYRPEKYLDIASGEQYRLIVQLGDSVQIISAWETVPEKVGIAEGTWEPTDYSYYNINGIPISRNGFNFLITTSQLPSDEVFLRWEYETTHINEAPFAMRDRNCYIQTIPQNFINSRSIFSSQGKPLTEHLIDFVPLDKRFTFRMTMLVRQIAQCKSAGAYYDFLFQQSRIQGTVFDPPPAVVSGNLHLEGQSEDVLYGLFEVGRLTEHTITIFRGEIDKNFVTYSSDCEQKIFNGITAPECYMCFMEAGAIPRPYYF